MGWPVCNSTTSDIRVNEIPFSTGITAHAYILWVTFGSTCVATILSVVQIILHAYWYSRPQEQKHIIRIHLMIPVYGVATFFEYLYYWEYVYYQLSADAYAAFALASFFSLLATYSCLEENNFNLYLERLKLEPWHSSWFGPIGIIRKFWRGNTGPWKTPTTGSAWYNIISAGIYQYCLVLFLMSLSGLISQIFDRYCVESFSPAFAHFWVLVLDACAAVVASYCLDQFHEQLKPNIKRRRTTFQIWCVKAILFLSLYQNLIVSALLHFDIVKASDKFQIPDIKIGIASCLLCVELMVIAVLHIIAYPVGIYKWKSNALNEGRESAAAMPADFYQRSPFGLRAFLDAFNPVDFVIGIWQGVKWLFSSRVRRRRAAKYTSLEADRSTGPEYELLTSGVDDRSGLKVKSPVIPSSREVDR